MPKRLLPHTKPIFLALAVFVFLMLFSNLKPDIIGQKSQQDAESFTPHRALYDIRLAGTRSGSQIVNIAGQMLYEWEKSCDGWLSNHQFNMVYEYADAPPMRIISNFSTFEAFDGQHLNFTSQRRQDGELFEELRGHALIKPGETGQATYTMPQDTSFDLPPRTIFPVHHTIEVARKLREGQKFYSAVIFDGSDEDGPVEVNSFIGKPVDILSSFTPTRGLDLSLLKSQAHKVRLAFFPLKNKKAAADYEMNLVFHENGIISDVVIEYDDFTISQKLIALEEIKDGCNSAGHTINNEKKDTEK